MAVDNDWKGAPLAHIIGSQSPWGAPEFPLVQPAQNHTVLYHIPGSGAQLDRPPKPQIGMDKWDQEHVRMPFSKHSLYPVENIAGESHLKSRWKMIHNALSKPIKDSKDLANAILSYNTQFKNRWKFHSLHALFEEYLEFEESQYFFDVMLPEIAKLALALPKLIQSPMPLLKQHKNCSISLSQQQISSLLANAFFCTFPRRNTTKKDSEYSSYPHINFNVTVPVGVVTVSRRSVQLQALPDWSSCQRPLSDLLLHVDPQSTIENAHGLIQVDFANKFLGGGVLGYGSVQEEIRFMICPELMISMLFTEVLRPNEALMIIGCEQYSKYIGYGHTFSWSGEHVDETPFDSSARRRTAVLAIDALPFASPREELRREALVRELNKAWVGFSFYAPDEPGLRYPGVATGNWGCGAFGGTAHLKSLIQIMALVRAGRPMAYYTFGDVKLRDDIIRIYNMLVKHRVTVGQLYKFILDYCQSKILRTDLYTFLEKVLEDKILSSQSQTTIGNQLETMEYNYETESNELPLTVELNLNKSPDLFSQDDDGQHETPTNNDTKNKESFINIDSNANEKLSDTILTKTETDPKITNNEQTIVGNHDVTVDTDHVMDTECKMLNTYKKMPENTNTPNQTSRLFNEMEKIDEDSGKLNFKSPQKSFGHTSKKKESPVGEEKIVIEVSPDLKKKLTKKITDYFSKKPV